MRSVSVGEFIIRELGEDDLELLNPVFRTMQQEYQRQYGVAVIYPGPLFYLLPGYKSQYHGCQYPERTLRVKQDLVQDG